MKRTNHSLALLGLLTTAMCCGCQTFGTPTIRAQSPSASGYGETSKLRGPYHTPIRSAAEELQDIHHEHHNTSTYYFSPNATPGAVTPQSGTSCPPSGPNCPPSYYGDPNCPPGGYGQCQNGQCHSAFYRDRFSYSYQVPNDLVYPPAGGVGGAVVYPYYTHKGPSDFFRQ